MAAPPALSAPNLTGDQPAVAVEPAAAELCASCPHPWLDHDAIAIRYCTATLASSGPPHGCVCT